MKATLPAFPIFVKPTSEGSAKGIDALSKAKNQHELERAVGKLRAKYPAQDILLEPFLAGRDLSISILGTGSEARVVGALEFFWNSGRTPEGQTFENSLSYSKERTCLADGDQREADAVVYDICQNLQEPQIARACGVALATWEALGCRDAGRVDIRFDKNGPDGTPNVLEASVVLRYRLCSVRGIG